MRTLIALSIVQTVLLGIIGIRVIALEARTQELARAPVEPQQRIAEAAPGPSAYGPTLTASDIRQILREELAASGAAKAANTTYAPTGAAAAASALSPSEASQMKSTAQQRLDYFVAQGEIGEAEMAELQDRIGALPAAERREMLSKLTKALSSGKLKGQL